VRTSEWIVLAYAGYVIAVSVVRPLKSAHRAGVVAGGVALAMLVAGVAGTPATSLGRVVRDFAPLASIFACYRLSGLLFVSPQPEVETRFARFDSRTQRLFGMPETVARAPRLLLEFLETSYVLCYPALPAGLLVLIASGRGGDADRYWSFIELATLGCYGMLPWIRTRAPWALEPPGPMDNRPVLVRKLNRLVIRNASITFNTFPSAHAACTLAAALAVVTVAPAAGAALFVVTAGVVAATFVGRYHYAGDAPAAVVTTLVVWVAVSLVRW
jgi:hypothetical protein